MPSHPASPDTKKSGKNLRARSRRKKGLAIAQQKSGGRVQARRKAALDFLDRPILR